eukprot:g1321.t1
MVPYHLKALVLRSCVQVLRLPPDCVSTALILLHKFKRAQSANPRTPVDEDLLIAACIFCAAKLEETECRTTDILSVVRVITDLPEGYNLSKVLPTALAKRGRRSRKNSIVAGEAYYSEKEKLISVEHILLRSINFDVVLPHPHRELLLLCRDLEVDLPITAIAIRLLNDALTFTDLVLKYETDAVVCSVLHTAINLSEVSTRRLDDRNRQGKNDDKWFAIIGFSGEVVETLGHELLDMLLEMNLMYG